VLLAIVGLGAFFRLYNLGGAAFRTDEGGFHEWCQMPISWRYICSHWFELIGDISGQFPFAPAFTKGFLDCFHLPASHFAVRLPSALWGILSIPIAFACGRELRGRWLGLGFAFMVAVNPFLIQATTESYYYPPMLAGVFVMLWVCLRVMAWAFQKVPLGRMFYAANATGFFLLAYSQPSGWSYLAMTSGTVAATVLWRCWQEKKILQVCPVVFASYLVIGLPLVFLPWALPQIRTVTTADHAKYVKRIFGEGTPIFQVLKQALTQWGWGAPFWRMVLNMSAILCGLLTVGLNRRRDWRYKYMLGLLLLGIVLFALSSKAIGGYGSSRHLAVYLPVYLLFITAGLFCVGEYGFSKIIKDGKHSAVLSFGLILLAGVPLLQPAWYCTQLTGKPVPYKVIKAWFDSHFAKGTPVLVDRWFEPWNELKSIYNSTNVHFTFTIPNEPSDVYLKYNWRNTVKDFFRKYPDAAYFELAKSYYDRPEVGPWDWPEHYFAQRVGITNEAGLKLRGLGLAYREDFYAANSNRMIVTVYYNTREDILKKVREDGQTTVVFYAAGWGYTKLWRQIQGDFRDWRVLESKEATLDVYNLESVDITRKMIVRAVAVNGAKRMEASNGSRYVFPQGQISEWGIENVMLKPGLNRVVLRKSGVDRGPSALLVADVRVLTQ
jgi:hypothetical protein